MTEHGFAQDMDTGRHQHARSQLEDKLTSTFRTATLLGLKVSTQGRLVGSAVMAVLLLYLVPLPAVYYYEAILVLFALMGIAYYVLSRRGFGMPWLSYIFIALDFALLTYTIFVPNPFEHQQRPPQVAFRNDSIVYYFMFFTGWAFSYSPKLMLWAGLSAALGWVAGVLWLLSLPETHTPFHHPPVIRNLVLLLLVAWGLEAVVRRSRRLIIRQVKVAHERAALARYFSPNVLDEVAEAVGPLTAVRKHEVAILFADIAGFTRLCETMPPENVMELLREYHSRLEEEVFRFGGTLDKFIGDAVMASFGAPRPGPQDGTNGLRCAHAMLQSMAKWNHQRAGIGETPIQIGIGLHYGLAVMGDVGSERCAAFAVIGDTTNTTSRLQSLTRDLGADIVVSQILLDAVRRETPEIDQELAGFRDAGQQPIRGRQNAMHVWMLPSTNRFR